MDWMERQRGRRGRGGGWKECWGGEVWGWEGRVRLPSITVKYYTLIMKLPGIDWDENKNAINKAKHKRIL
ncbi:hypothetical protein AGMMS49546_18250 [Spirochaetia bacterium]|nr:hypothetical protein AGMMS49546_18250 [Spirochaetia bacterium]